MRPILNNYKNLAKRDYITHFYGINGISILNYFMKDGICNSTSYEWLHSFSLGLVKNFFNTKNILI